MDRISRKESVQFGDLRIVSLLFADDVVLLASSHCDLQHAVGQFAAECEVVGMKVSTSKSEAMVLCQKKVDCSLWVGSELLPQVEREINRRISAASAVMRTLHQTVVVRELSRKAKLSIYQSIYVTALTYVHELWVVIERMRLRIKADEMSFLHSVAGLSLRDRVRNSGIRRELGVEPVLLRVERSQLRWFGHLIRMPPGHLPVGVFWACPTSRRPRGRPRTCWRDYISHLAWECLGIPPEELESVAGERDVWTTLLSLLLPRPGPG